MRRANHSYYYNHEATKDEALDRISREIRHLWHRRFHAYPMHDVDSEWQFINRMRARYTFPDYLSLVGEPTISDFTSEGHLRWERMETGDRPRFNVQG